jgi:RNA polymerase sigma-70 factor (ECF subfamily)
VPVRRAGGHLRYVDRPKASASSCKQMTSRPYRGRHSQTQAEPTSGAESQPERALVEAARRGDAGAYEALVEPRRSELRAHCYRMLGSSLDAEEVLQEVLLRAWRGLGRFDGRSSIRTWLFRIATNSCLDELQRRSKRVLPVAVGPGYDLDSASGVETEWLEPYPGPWEAEGSGATPEARYEERESVELAFVAAIQWLAPNERAVLLLREVLGFSAREAAELLQTTSAAVNSALQRARRSLKKRLPKTSQQEVQRSLGEAGVRRVVERYMEAMERADVGAVIALLTADATWSMPPLPVWYRGHKAIAGFLEHEPFQFRWRHVATQANSQPAVASYWWVHEAGCFVARALDVFTLRGSQIESITAFLDTTHVARSGLPLELPATA